MGHFPMSDDNIVNYRASYVQETAAVISAALESGLKIGEICAYVQNDAYGMAGIAGVKAALSAAGGSQEVVGKLDEIMALGGDNPFRNNVGPVGVYKRNTFTSREGYDSLTRGKAMTPSRHGRRKPVSNAGW